MDDKPTVSIICLTYNQEKYVRDCLDGFIAQKTDFPYEVLIYDDASTDATPEIIKDYTSRFPSVFKPTFYQVNNYSQGLGFVGLYTGIKEAKGKYVAYCEGDDYWTDPLKLQKQVDFLEANPDYAICAHETLVRNEDYAKLDGLVFSEFTKNLFISTSGRHFTFRDTLTGNIFHISSMMYRNRNLTLPRWLPTVSACDMVLYMILAREGDVYVLPDIMSVYRGHLTSLTSSQAEFGTAIKFHQLSIRILRLMNHYWKREYQKLIYPLVSRYYVECSMLCLRKSQRDWSKSKEMAFLAWCYDKRTASRYIAKGLASKVTSRICRT